MLTHVRFFKGVLVRCTITCRGTLTRQMLREEMRSQGLHPNREANFLDENMKVMSLDELQAEVDSLAGRKLNERTTTEQIKSWFVDPRSEVFPNGRKGKEKRDSNRLQEHEGRVDQFVHQLEKSRYSEAKLPPHNGKLRARSLEAEKKAWAKNLLSVTGLKLKSGDIPRLPNAAEALVALLTDNALTRKVTLIELAYRIILIQQLLFQDKPGINGCFCSKILNDVGVDKSIRHRFYPSVDRSQQDQAQWGDKSNFDKTGRIQLTLHLLSGDCMLMPKAMEMVMICPFDYCQIQEQSDQGIDFRKTKKEDQSIYRLAREASRLGGYQLGRTSLTNFKDHIGQKHKEVKKPKSLTETQATGPLRLLPYTTTLYSVHLLNRVSRRANEKVPKTAQDSRSIGQMRTFVAGWQVLKRNQIYLFNHCRTRYPDINPAHESLRFPGQMQARVDLNQRRNEGDSEDIRVLQEMQGRVYVDYMTKIAELMATTLGPERIKRKEDTGTMESITGKEQSAHGSSPNKKLKLVKPTHGFGNETESTGVDTCSESLGGTRRNEELDFAPPPEGTWTTEDDEVACTEMTPKTVAKLATNVKSGNGEGASTKTVEQPKKKRRIKHTLKLVNPKELGHLGMTSRALSEEKSERLSVYEGSKRDWTKEEDSDEDFRARTEMEEFLGNPQTLADFETKFNKSVGPRFPVKRDKLHQVLILNKPVISIKSREDIIDFCRELKGHAGDWFFSTQESLTQVEINRLAVYARYSGGEPVVMCRVLVEECFDDNKWREAQTTEVGLFLDGVFRQHDEHRPSSRRSSTTDLEGIELANGVIKSTRTANGYHQTYGNTGVKFGIKSVKRTLQAGFVNPKQAFEATLLEGSSTLLILVADETEEKMTMRCTMPRELMTSTEKSMSGGLMEYGTLEVRFGSRQAWVENIRCLPDQLKKYQGSKKKNPFLSEMDAFMVVVSPYGQQMVYEFDNMYQFTVSSAVEIIDRTFKRYQDLLLLGLPRGYACEKPNNENMPQQVDELLLKTPGPGQYDLRQNGARPGLTKKDNLCRIRLHALQELLKLVRDDAAEKEDRDNLKKMIRYIKNRCALKFPQSGENLFLKTDYGESEESTERG